MHKRPTSITVISILLIVFGALSLVSGVTIYFMQDNEVYQEALKTYKQPVWVQVAIIVTSSLIQIGSAIAMLKGAHMGRIVYAATSVAGLVYSFVVSPNKLTPIPSCLFVGVICYFLFRQSANDYFKPSGADNAVDL